MQQTKGIGQKENLKKEYQKIKAGLIINGTNFYRFCSENGIHRGNAMKAFNGQWNGKKAKALRQRLVDASRANLNTR